MGTIRGANWEGDRLKGSNEKESKSRGSAEEGRGVEETSASISETVGNV